ncbi:transmembrane protein 81-like [Xenopus laevis]|uniref:Transmembrane protein 81 n=1 Tax=Xenopus laevis TaxID=8355 RepID=A0A8J1LV33_XENLA|nr:transmembrane protein 81-like [Xenopus laevis]XP_041432878.1 transmembrane protein 81-like [Xenopus laevis]XP_041432896.1 transmembrane protein 81-like [Xenopus laevis]XP_041432915.1 transmembrane protein 81-like [Xenopus laevis]
MTSRMFLLFLFSILFISFVKSQDEKEVYKPELMDVQGMVDLEDKGPSAGFIVVESGECSVTCGNGVKMEKRCFVDTSGETSDCQKVMSPCSISVPCQLMTFQRKPGDEFAVDCMTEEEVKEQGEVNIYWKHAKGIITTDARVFRPLKLRSSILTFPSLQVENTGTYRCDAQRKADGLLAKQVYFGLKVINPEVFDLEFRKYVRNKKFLEDVPALETEDTEKVSPQPVNKLLIIVATGIGTGLLVGIVIWLLLLFLCRAKPQQPDLV